VRGVAVGFGEVLLHVQARLVVAQAIDDVQSFTVLDTDDRCAEVGPPYFNKYVARTTA
jgi:hypothetical protein